ncbi:MAG: hypothetical protein ACU0DK_11810 [Pseudooceanicola sp.]
MRFVTKTLHARLDYPVALALIILPFLLGLGTSHPLALIISPTVGVTALLLTVFTDHHLGLIRVLPYGLHLAVDLVVGLLFLVLPFGLGFSGIDAGFYWLNGAAVVAVIALSKPETDMASAWSLHSWREPPVAR